jgi:hypothetical protein
VTFWFTALLLGCSPAQDKGAAAVSLDSGLTGGDGMGGDGGLDSGPAAPGPAWWVARGTFVLSGGQAAAVTVEIDVKDEDLAPFCAVSAASVGVVEVQPAPDDAVYLWLDVTDIAWAGSCVAQGGAPAGVGLRFGVGALHPDVQAVVGASADTALGASAGAFNGAYVQAGAVPYAVGVAGPAAAWEGVGAPADGAPLPDGEWRWQALYAMPFTGWVAPAG